MLREYIKSTMSLVFLKSRDKQAKKTRHNPNKPYSFSNYLTQPIEIPPNSQVAYVSSTFNIDDDLAISEGTMRLLFGLKELDYPMRLISDRINEVGNPSLVVNELIQPLNEYGINDMFVNKLEAENTLVGTSLNKAYDFGYNFFYDRDADKVQITATQTTGVDNFNLDFNALNQNPAFDSISWDGVPGGTYPAKINWNELYSEKYHNDLTTYQFNSPAGNATFDTAAVQGLRVGIVSDDADGVENIYLGGPNYYNTGYLCADLATNTSYDFTIPSDENNMPSYRQKQYPLITTATGIRRVVGNVAPSSDPQRSNTGGHQYIGALNSGGYAIWAPSNTAQSLADQHYDDTIYGTSKVGFTGIAPQFVGVHSIEMIKRVCRGNTLQEKLQDFVSICDLNDSASPDTPLGAFPRYLFGLRIEELFDELDSNKLVVYAEILDGSFGSSENNSLYEVIGNKPLDIEALSGGVNTCVPEGQDPVIFDSGANYHIQTYDNETGEDPAMLFFRFRWINPYQMCIEYTLSVDGVDGAYNNATDTPYAPSVQSNPNPSTEVPVPVPSSETIELDATTNGTTRVLTNNTTFLDSGGSGGNYSDGENYYMDFDAGAGYSVTMLLNSFEFEHASFIMYDRFSVQVSNDGLTYTNVILAGFQTSANTTYPYSGSFGGSNYNSSQSYPGWILPLNPTRYAELGGDISETINLNSRYVRFGFTSDGSANRPGWNITLKPDTPYLTDPSAFNPANFNPLTQWCLLASMNMKNVDLEQRDIFFPTYFGDMILNQFPVASSNGDNVRSDFKTCTKGYYNPRITERSIVPAQSDDVRYPLYKDPSTQDKTFFNNDNMVPLQFYYERIKKVQSSPIFLNNGDDSTLTFNNTFTNLGIYDYQFGSDTMVKLLSVELKTKEDAREILNQKQTIDGGEVLFPRFEPNGLELGYSLGYVRPNQRKLIFTGQVDGATKRITLTATDDLDVNSKVFNLHVQLTNLPIQSQNGPVSSQNKTIQVINSLCIAKTYDDVNFRFFCDQAPRLIWIDLNNAQPISLNKLDVSITDDENQQARYLCNDTDLVIMFRKKDELNGNYPNNLIS